MRPHVVHWLEAVFPTSLASSVAPSWFTCVGLAGIVALFWMLAIARRHELDAGAIASVVLWCYLAAVTAGIVVPMAIDAAEQLITHGRVHLRWAGMTSFWGYLAGGCAVAAVCRAHRLPLAWLGDLAAAPLGAALALARLGCFLGGCDYGKVTSVPWATRFPSGSPAWHDHVNAGLVAANRAESLPVHPTQLYEAVLGLLIAVVASVAARERWVRSRDGRLFRFAAATYAIGRIIIESFRGDAGRGIYLGLSSGQIFSSGALAAIAGGWLLRRRRAGIHRRSRNLAAATVVLIILVAPDAAHAQPAMRAYPPQSPQPAPTTPDPMPRARSAQQPAGPPSPTAQPATSGAPQPAGPAPFAGPSAQPPAGPTSPAQSPAGPTPSAQQPAGPTPPSQPPWGAPPQLAPSSAPIDPYVRPATAGSSSRTSFHVGLLVGLAAPLNRRRDQVAMLGGPSLSLGLALRGVTLGLDLDSLGNTDASHGTALVSAGVIGDVAPRLHIGGRVGLGATLVNFDDPAFRDVAGASVRFEAIAEYDITDSWAAWLRPLSFDLLAAEALGGSILTWQLRLGVGYHFGGHHRSAMAPPRSPAVAPAPHPPASEPPAHASSPPAPPPQDSTSSQHSRSPQYSRSRSSSRPPPTPRSP